MASFTKPKPSKQNQPKLENNQAKSTNLFNHNNRQYKAKSPLKWSKNIHTTCSTITHKLKSSLRTIVTKFKNHRNHSELHVADYNIYSNQLVYTSQENNIYMSCRLHVLLNVIQSVKTHFIKLFLAINHPSLWHPLQKHKVQIHKSTG